MNMTKLAATLAVAALSAGCVATGSGQAVLRAVDTVAASVAAAQGQPAAPGAPGQSAAASAPARGEMIVSDNVVLAIGGGKPADPRWSGTPLRETPLMGIFKSSPLGRCSPCYPRVAVKIKDYSETLLTVPVATYIRGVNNPTPRPPECVKFDAKIWRSPKQSEDVRDVLVCNSLIQKDDGSWARVQMRNFDLSVARGDHTQEVRSMGPLAPRRLLGANTKADQDLWSNGFYLFGNLFLLTGYEGLRQIDNIPDDRMWFVNLAKKT